MKKPITEERLDKAICQLESMLLTVGKMKAEMRFGCAVSRRTITVPECTVRKHTRAKHSKTLWLPCTST